jgi:ABC-type spermidine/putrescine transport system permease subunit I
MTTSSKISRSGVLLIAAPVLIYCLLFVLPIGLVGEESLRLFHSGSVGAAKNAPLTLANYTELLHPAFLFYFFDTFRIALFGAVLSVLLGFPIAYIITRARSAFWRRFFLTFVIVLISVSTLVRVYALQLTLGSVGLGPPIARFFGLLPSSSAYASLVVLAGLVYFQTPISALILLGTVEKVNPRLAEAAQTLGVPRWRAHASITVPLCLPGIMTAFLIDFTLCVSAFIIPMILGQGKVQFISNLVFSRFSEVANYPSGSALSMVLLATTLTLAVFVPRLVSRLFRGPISQ